MPYTIALREVDATSVVQALDKALDGSRFTAKLENTGPTRGYRGRIVVKPVRLRESKLYCGQHPGSCIAEPKRKSRCLEWDDWVEFHSLVNDVLDAKQIVADVWTNPPESLTHGKRMWVRQGLARRATYDWHDDPNDRTGGIFRNVNRIWNHGTPDQFAEV
jgi:hypothetical protein